MSLWGGFLTAAGMSLVVLGHVDFLPVTGFLILIAGVLIAIGKKAGVFLYFAGVGVAVVWSLATGAGLGGAIVPVLVPILIGLLLCRRSVLDRLS